MFGICDLNSIFVVFTPRTRHISLSKWVYFYAHLKAYITKIYGCHSHWIPTAHAVCTVLGGTGGDSLSSFYTQILVLKCQEQEVLERT